MFLVCPQILALALALALLPILLSYLHFRSRLNESRICFAYFRRNHADNATAIDPYDRISGVYRNTGFVAGATLTSWPWVGQLGAVYAPPSDDLLQLLADVFDAHTIDDESESIIMKDFRRKNTWCIHGTKRFCQNNSEIGGEHGFLKQLPHTANASSSDKQNNNDIRGERDLKQLPHIAKARSSGKKNNSDIGGDLKQLPHTAKASSHGKLVNQTLSFLPDGVYWNETTSVVVKCQGSPQKRTSNLKGIVRLVEEDNDRANRLLTTAPATTLLLLAIGVMAFRFGVSDAGCFGFGISYEKVIEDGELWRIFSGSLYHRGWLHFAVNCHSLYSLGLELEETFGSVPFFLYNISLIPVTIFLTLGLIHQRYASNSVAGGVLARRQTLVGYSAVLFAWCAVAAVRLPISIPFPKLAPQLVFRTYKFGFLSFNASPLLRAAVIHFAVPSTSLEGHVAGIVAGLALSPHFLPLSWWQPAILIPQLWYCHAAFSGKLSAPSARIHSFSRVHINNIGYHESIGRAVKYIAFALTGVCCLGWMWFDVSMRLQSVSTIVILVRALEAHGKERAQCDQTSFQRRKQQSQLLWKLVLLSCFLSIVTDGMTMGGWLVGGPQSKNLPIGVVAAVCVLSVQIFLQCGVFVIARDRFKELRVGHDHAVFVGIFAAIL